MATARFTGTAAETQQFKDAGGDDSQDWLEFDDPEQKAATTEEGEASKSAGKTGDQPQQAEGGANAPPKENPPAPIDPKPGTRKATTDQPVVDSIRTPPKTPPKTPPNTQKKKHPPISQSMSKVISRQENSG